MPAFVMPYMPFRTKKGGILPPYMCPFLLFFNPKSCKPVAR